MSEGKKLTNPEYTVEDILDMYEARVKDNDEARLRMIAPKIRDMCRLEHDVNIPTTYKAITKEFRTPFMRDSALRIASSLVGKKPLTHIIPKNDKDSSHRDSANIAEKWDAAFVDRQNKQQSTDIDFENAMGLVRDGESVLKVVHVPDAWANFPQREDDDADSYDDKVQQFAKSSDLPIAWRNVDRLCAVRENGEYGDAWVLEYGEYTKPYLRSKYSLIEHPDSKRLINPKRVLEGKPMPEGLRTSVKGRTVKVEFFTPREWHVIIDGNWAPGFPKYNPYAPSMPYFFAGAYELESLLYSLMYLVPRMDELLTMKMCWSALSAYPNPVIKTLPNQTGLPSMDIPVGDAGEVGHAASPGNELKWTPGHAIDMPMGKELYFLSPPPVGKDLNDLVVILKGMIDIAGIPSIMRGISGSGDSGYLANQMLAAVQMAYQLATIALQRQREQALEFTHELGRSKIKQPIYVQGYMDVNARTGKPKKGAKEQWIALDIKGGANTADVNKLGAVQCTYRPTLPTDAQANAMIAMQLTNAPNPLFDVRHALEDLMQVEDADAIMDAMYVEKKLNSDPQLDQDIVTSARRRAGLPVGAGGGQGAGQGAPQLVGPDGQTPLLPAGINNLQASPVGGPVPMANEPIAGGPSVAGINRPVQPGVPVPQGRGMARGGGRPAGAYPGRPSNQGG